MSQAGSINVNSAPSIPTSFTTDDGVATPVANNINLLADDTTENNTNGIQSSGSGNTVTIELTNRLQGTTTVEYDVTPTGDLITFDLGASAAVYRIKFEACGKETTTDDGVGYTVDVSVKTDGASATIIQTPNIYADEDAALLSASMTAVASGNNVVLRATGVTGTTISYSAVGYYVVV